MLSLVPGRGVFLKEKCPVSSCIYIYTLGLVPGRGVFLKEKCPVSSCVISSNRVEADSSDLILFKVYIKTLSNFKSGKNHSAKKIEP